MMNLKRFSFLVLTLVLLATAAFLSRPTHAAITAVPQAIPYFLGEIDLYSGDMPRAALGEVLYFVGEDAIHGRELWRSDGTAEGTALFRDFSPDLKSAPPAGLAVINNTLYLFANNGGGGDTYALWQSDGTAEGTVILRDNLQEPTPWLVQHPAFYLFTEYDEQHGVELWRSDGTAEGTQLLKDINLGPESSSPVAIAAHNGLIYFSAETTAQGYELWRTDGTTEGTIQVADINPGTGSSYPNEGVVFNGVLYFSATADETDPTLWHSDGTSAGTSELTGDVIEPSNFMAVGGRFFFTPFHPDYGRELWQSDGTAEGTTLVKDILAGSTGSFPTDLAPLNGKLYFSADDGTHGDELWQSDGTEAGTLLVKDFNTGSPTGITFGITAAPDRLYIGATDGVYGTELWQSDGSEAGTIRLTDINPNSGDSNPNQGIIVGDRFFFEANDGSNMGLWAAADPQAGPTFTVNNTTDSNDGSCTLGHCSLREAISAANAQAGANTILFSETAYGTITPATALPTITETLHINGPDSSFLTVDGTLVTHSSLMRVSAGSLTMNGLTIAQGGGINTPVGGALQAQAPVTLTDVRFVGNRATVGGAVALYTGGILNHVEFEDNHAAETNGGALVAYNGTVTISNSRFHNNTAVGNGGAIYMQGNFLNVYTSEFSGNQAANGGAIYADVDPTIERTSFHDNHATADGGAIYATSIGSASVSNSLLVGNAAVGFGHAFYLGGSGIGVNHHFLHNTIAATQVITGTAVQMAAGGILHVSNNIIANQNVGLARTSGTLNEDYNLFHDNDTNHTGITGGTNSLVGDPLFVSADDALYQLLPSSPAVDAGTASAVNVDYNNRPRPQGTAPDMGFDEVAQAAVTGLGGYDIGGTGVSITVTQTGDLAAVQLAWVPLAHPNSGGEGGSTGANGYWTILGTNGSGQSATGFSLTLTLPHENEANPAVCRWDGAAWDCGRDGFTSTHVWRDGITAFSDWAVGVNTAAGHDIYLPLITR